MSFDYVQPYPRLVRSSLDHVVISQTRVKGGQVRVNGQSLRWIYPDGQKKLTSRIGGETVSGGYREVVHLLLTTGSRAVIFRFRKIA